MGQKKTTPEENHGLQKVAAQNFKRDWPATESVKFTQEGSTSGAGVWSANAIVTIGGKDYQEIIGPEQLIGEDLPDPGSLPATDTLTVHYSDGTSEVLR